ncbi:acyltransferase [Telmatocola sphagniphila]|uniref:Acyltransferase n=1 Tax=Telmatocola sphagniphila TaxID=1123043 RepID=A0A8E6B3P1_9BACT|nr:acyltransferase [Telmatocola sphagniphila]QVL31141.1 acyltransferase [Telmatocola sphagniphila]
MKSIVKSALHFLANIAAFPFVLVYFLKVPVLGKDRSLEGSTEQLAILPGVSGQYIRRAFLAWTIEKCHPSATICFGVIFSKTQARIEENVYIGSRCQLGKVHVQRDVLIASGTHVTSGSKMHGIDDPNVPIREQEGVFEKVTIGAGSWIGSLAVVMADVGKNCVIGAGAVVTKSIPDQCVAGGVPAKVIRERV